jgi:O-antigen ligase
MSRRGIPSWRLGASEPLAYAAAALMVLGVVLGGASRDNALRVMILELAGLPVLAWALWRWLAATPGRDHRLTLGLMLAIVALPALQLIPLPPGLWTHLPGRDLQVAGLQAIGVPPGWAPVSLKPLETLRSLLALIPPLALFLAAALLDGPARARLAMVVALLAAASALLGVLQITLDLDILRLYARIHEGRPIGFFPNRNHQAALMCVAAPLTAAWVFGGLRTGERPSGARLLIGLVLIGLMVVTAVATRSRAGTVIMGLILLLGLGLVLRESRPGRRVSLVIAGGAVAAALGMAALVTMTPVLQRFDQEQVAQDQRFAVWPDIAGIAQGLGPVGGGVGGFETVYRSQERLEAMRQGFMNHAHNDYLEIWMEGGWLGLALLLAAFAWAGWRGWRAWTDRSGAPVAAQGRAASLVLVALAAHSIIDYPLRTPALAMTLALACALLIPPVGRERRRTA